MPNTVDTDTMLSLVKLALRVTTDAFNTELSLLIEAACLDLGVVGVTADSTTTDPLLIRAIVTYCRLNFGSPDDYDRLRASYAEQKAQLITCTGYGLEE